MKKNIPLVCLRFKPTAADDDELEVQTNPLSFGTPQT